MLSLFERELARIDGEIANTPPAQIPSLFRSIPLEVYADFLIATPDQYPNIRAYLPTLPSEEIQRRWCGAQTTTRKLMRKSINFTWTLLGAFGELTAGSIESARVLDFGCGWGRLTRMLAKYVREDRLYGVDPDEHVLSMCRQHGVHGTFARSDPIPKSLPFDESFELIFAFSVFTHLSEITAKTAVPTLRRYQSDNGLLAVTIRPVEYWRYRQEAGSLSEEVAADMGRAHARTGFAFLPFPRQSLSTEVTYGDASMSIEFAEQLFDGYRLDAVEHTAEDMLQVVLLFTPA